MGRSRRTDRTRPPRALPTSITLPGAVPARRSRRNDIYPPFPERDERESPDAARRTDWKQHRAPDPERFAPPGIVRPEVPRRSSSLGSGWQERGKTKRERRRNPRKLYGSRDRKVVGSAREPVPWRKTLESSHLRMVNGRRAGVRENRGDTADCYGRGEASKGGASRKAKTRKVPRYLNGSGRNAANPRIGCGMQQARKTHDGGNRQGGGKPRRWNRTCSLARAGRSEAEPRREPRWNQAGVDIKRSDRWRGDLWKTHERRLEKSRQGRKESVSRRGLRVVGGAASADPLRNGRPPEPLKRRGRTVEKPTLHTP
jgi:hypothetical protein